MSDGVEVRAMVDKLGALRVIPVVTLREADRAQPLADALREGGLPCAEITFRTEAAAASIRALRSRADLLVGAGTVLDVETARRAVDAGARFLVAPGVNPPVVEYCVQREIPLFPGIATPSDIDTARRFGLEVVKFFPAQALGGLATLKAISAPYPMMRFIPTGGIDAGNAAAWLESPRVLAVGGSWMVKPSLLEEGRYGEIARLTAEAVQIAASSHS